MLFCVHVVVWKRNETIDKKGTWAFALFFEQQHDKMQTFMTCTRMRKKYYFFSRTAQLPVVFIDVKLGISD